MFIILLTETYFAEQCEVNLLLRLHGNSGYANVPQCYAIQSDSLAGGPKLLSIKTVIEIIT